MFLYEKGHHITTMKNKILLTLICLLLLSSFSYAGTWTSLEDFGGAINALAVYDGNLFTANSNTQLRTYKNGVWFNLEYEEEPYVPYSLAVYDGNLFIGTQHGLLGTYHSGSYVRYVADLGGDIAFLEVYDDNLFYVQSSLIGTYNNDSGVATDLGLSVYNAFAIGSWSGHFYTNYADDECKEYVDGTPNSIGTGGECYALLSYGNMYIASPYGLGLGIYDDSIYIQVIENSALWDTPIKVLAFYDGNIFTGHIDGTLGTYNNISKTWTNLGDIGEAITALAVFDGNLFTGQSDGTLGTYKTEAPPEPEPPIPSAPATINIDPLFQAITGLFSIFSGIIMGVTHQSTNIGQFFGIGLILSAVVVVFGALFVVMKNGVGGFGRIFQGKI